MKKQSLRQLSLILALLMLFSVVPVAAAFSGMDSWAEAEVGIMVKEGLIPESLMDADLRKPISRLDMCRIAVLAYEKRTGGSIIAPEEHPFTDTTDEAAEKAFAAGIINGNGNGSFRPEDPLSRLEFFVIVCNFLHALDFPIQGEDYADLSGFADAASLPEWGVEYASLTVGLGIVNGSSSGLNWSASASCQEGIALFCRTYQKTAELIPAEPVAFENLAQWAEESVLQMDGLGLIPDTVKYAPMDGAITRQDLCKVLMATYRFITGITDEDLGTPGDPFTDTDDMDVRNAYRLGIVNGKGNGIFAPEEPIIRQDFFRMTVNFLNAIGFPYADDETVDLSRFSDADLISDYAEGAIRLLVGIEIVNGNADGTLSPKDNIVSQEALVVFYRVFCFMSDWGTEEPPAEEPENTEPVETEPTEPETTEPEPTEPEPSEPEPTEPETTEPSEPEDSETPVIMGTVNTNALTIRTGPGTEYESVGLLYRNDRVKILEQQSDDSRLWGRISRGWICLDYVILDSDEPVEDSDLCQQIVDFAKTLLGCNYIAGGKKPETGFDCSGFVYYVYKNFGYTLNPGATNQWNHLSDEIIPEEELRPGDLVFFSENGAVSGMTHVGIYIGDGQFIHAENYQNGVTITDLSQRYYAQRYLGAKRVVE